MGELSAQPQQATWLGWIPLPALVLARDGSAVAVNERWTDLSPVPANGQGWLEAAEPEFRSALRATLLLAATTGEPGSADCPVIGPRGARRSRWWWQPLPPGGLVVCVAATGVGPAGVSAAGDARDPVASGHTRAARSASISAELDMAAVHQIFQAGMALESAGSLLPGPAAALVLGVVDYLDQLVGDLRDAALRKPTRRTPPPPHEVQGEAGIPAVTPATRELLDSVVNGIFTAGMGLQAATGLLLPEAAAQRITEALCCLDEVIREVRDHILTEHDPQAQPGQRPRPGPDARERRQLAYDHAAPLHERGAAWRERGNALRERVAQTAYALHLAAADTAALLERRSDLADQPGRIDYLTEIKRWRDFADQARQMAGRWEHG